MPSPTSKAYWDPRRPRSGPNRSPGSRPDPFQLAVVAGEAICRVPDREGQPLLPLEHRLPAFAPSLVRLLFVLGQLQRHEAVEIGVGRLAQCPIEAEGDRLL